MSESSKKHQNRFAVERTLHWLVPVVMCFFATACGTTGGQKESATASNAQSTSQVQQAKASCTGAPNANPSNTNPQNGETQPVPPQQNCLPKGVIEFTETNPVDPEVREEFQQAVMLLKEEKYSEAIRLLRGVTGKASKFTGPHINLGIAYARTGELEKAEESLKKALELNPYHPVANNELGLVYRKTGRYAEARQIYEALLTMYPDYLPVRKNFGVLCDIYLQDLSCAIEQYEAYLEGIPDDEKVKIWVADVKSRM
jgi:tetratricopeptide (TPR) repeat protein